MSEVERFKCIGYMVGRSRLGGAEYVFLSDFDRVTAERDAALAENKLLRHNVASYLETVAKVCDMLSVDLESAKTAEGKPSDVLFGYVSLMQQRLTAADERADVLEGALRELLAGTGNSPGANREYGKARAVLAGSQKQAAPEPYQGIPGTSFQRLNALANQGE